MNGYNSSSSSSSDSYDPNDILVFPIVRRRIFGRRKSGEESEDSATDDDTVDEASFGNEGDGNVAAQGARSSSGEESEGSATAPGDDQDDSDTSKRGISFGVAVQEGGESADDDNADNGSSGHGMSLGDVGGAATDDEEEDDDDASGIVEQADGIEDILEFCHINNWKKKFRAIRSATTGGSFATGSSKREVAEKVWAEFGASWRDHLKKKSVVG